MDTLQQERAPNLIHTTWAALIEETLKPVMLVSLAAYWIWQFWYSADARTPISSNTVFTTLYSATLVFACWYLTSRWPRLAIVMWGAGLCAGAFVVGLLLAIQPPNILILLAGLLVAIFLGEATAAATVLAGILPLFILRELWGFSSGEAMSSLGWSAALIALGGQLHRGLQRMIDWSLTSYQQALDNTAEARRRRGELAKVVKELDTAYYRLSRLNASLIEAWQRASEAESRRAELVTTISHEMRTPLNLILGFSEMIMASPESYNHVPLPSVYRPDVTAIYRSSMHLLQLIDDILDLAKADVGKLVIVRQKADLREIALECMTMLEEYIHTKGLELRCNIEPELPPVNIDRLRIRQVILNLLTNAARFTDVGYIEVAARQQGEEILVIVRDTGRGMSPEKVQTIFQEFEAATTNDENWHSGTGLGVPISKKLVELHGGRMWLESEPQKGTTFYFTLPL
ncbi:MAG: HAMP domain-containing histidine kinase, partial [Chloroflexi bacterium]|nr:HAMP domain-containing histidine kinase [Chloroflexota bacterium]